MSTTPVRIRTGQTIDVPPWLPGVVARMLPNFACRTAREAAILQRLATDPRMERVWRELARIEILRCKSIDTAIGALFSLAFHTAAEDLPITTRAERRSHIQAAGGWHKYFTTPIALRDGLVAVSHKGSDPVAKRLQQTLTLWMQREFGGPHISLVNTIAEVALGRDLSRWSARPPRGKSSPPRITAAGR